MIILTLLLNANKLHAQVRLAPVVSNGGANGFLGIISFKPTLAKGDSTIKTVSLFNQENLLGSFRVKIKSDGSFQVIDNIIKDSILNSTFKSDTSIKYVCEGCKVLLINAKELTDQYPIEDVLFITTKATEDSASKITSLLRNTQLDSSIKGIKPITIKGNITTIGQLSDNKYVGQTIPQNYIRTYVNSEVSVFGAPFNVGYNYTTESNEGLNKINNFRVSFNYEKFYQNLKNSAEKKINAEKEENLKHLSKFDINELNKEYGKLATKINSPEFLKQIEKQKKMLEVGEQDSAFKKTYRYKKASQQIESYNKTLKRLKELETEREQFLNNARIANMGSEIKQIGSSTPSGFKKSLKRLGLSAPYYNLLLDIKKFDLGTFDPNYTTLVLSGVSLSGVNVEVNHGNAYGAFTWGNSVANFSNPFAIDLSGGRTIMAGRMGVGRTEKMLLAFSILKGTDGSNNRVHDSSYNYYLPQFNYVTGVDFKYKFNNIVDVGLEYAKSENQEISKEARTNTEVYGNLVSLNNKKYTSAWSGVMNINLNENKTKFKFLVRSVDPFYYSFGTPYLRKDDLRIESKGEQSFLKKQLTTSVSYRHDEDNLYNLKEATTKNNAFIFNLQLRIKKYPFLILTYSPNYISSFNSSNKQFISTEVKIYNGIIGYVSNRKNAVYTSTISYTKQYSRSTIEGYKLLHTDQYTLTENVMIKPIDLTVTSLLNYSLPLTQSDTGKVMVASVMVSKNFAKKKLSINGGYSYQKDFTIQVRNIIQAGASFSLGWGINCTIRIERHFIKSYKAEAQNQDMNLGRITLIKNF